MKNAIISIIIFFFLLIFIGFLNNSILNLCYNIDTQLNEIETLLYNKDKNSSYEKSLELLTFLNKNDLITSIYVNHTDFDTIRYEATRLNIYISQDDDREAYASLNVIKQQTKTIKHLQKIISYHFRKFNLCINITNRIFSQ